jgi:hypothetical protein
MQHKFVNVAMRVVASGPSFFMLPYVVMWMPHTRQGRFTVGNERTLQWIVQVPLHMTYSRLKVCGVCRLHALDQVHVNRCP